MFDLISLDVHYTGWSANRMNSKHHLNQSDLPIRKDLHLSTQLIGVMCAQQAIICNQDGAQASSRTAQDICMKRITYHRNTMIENADLPIGLS